MENILVAGSSRRDDAPQVPKAIGGGKSGNMH